MSDISDCTTPGEIRVLHFSELTDHLIDQLWQLTKPYEDDGMRVVIRDFLRGDLEQAYAIMMFKQGRVIAWSSLDLERHDGDWWWNVNIFTEHGYRGQGFGGQLLDVVVRKFGHQPIRVYPQDKSGETLFRKRRYECFDICY